MYYKIWRGGLGTIIVRVINYVIDAYILKAVTNTYKHFIDMSKIFIVKDDIQY